MRHYINHIYQTYYLFLHTKVSPGLTDTVCSIGNSEHTDNDNGSRYSDMQNLLHV